MLPGVAVLIGRPERAVIFAPGTQSRHLDIAIMRRLYPGAFIRESHST